MKKDIFIDNNIASKFCNPLDPEYKKLIKWLLQYDEEDVANIENYAHLAISEKLYREYVSSNQNAISETSIVLIESTLRAQGRLNEISKEQIANFRKTYITKAREKNLLSNEKDRNHIPVVLLSDRKYALTNDKNFTHDLVNFPGHKVIVAKKPEDLPYSE